MNTKRTCSSCGTELPADAPSGLCVPCLLKNALPPTEPAKPGGSPQATIHISAIIPASEKPGDRIGRYKLLQEIGEGGMGTVWMAEQEQPVRRRVALKVIKLGMDTKQVIGRFEAERQALAMMDHPNIAKVLDAGATDNGRPYFVMELVKGIPITKYCDDNKVGTKERLELFIEVCRAIQHAHQKGIIHRDIKPSNILIANHDGQPVPKVIDFGIAKATTDQKLTDKTVFTAFEQFIGTPAYMSPEQAEMNALDIDTRTDVYSLGVLLYELLTGKTPFDAKDLISAGLEGMRKMIREREPARPSTRISSLENVEQTTVADQRHSEPPKLVHLVHGDLDWVAMKCLEKDRTRRYETANGLAADIERHLKNEPVVACPPSNLYRFQKLVRRNKLAFASVSAVIVALVIGLGLATWQFFKERQARERAVAAEKNAKEEAAKSQQVAQFLEDMLKGVGPSVAMGRDTALLREILDQTAERVVKDLKDQPAVQSELLSTIGHIYYDLSEHTKAEVADRESLRLRKILFGETNVLVATSLHDLAVVLWKRSKNTEAESLHREALAMRETLLGDEHPDVAISLNSLGLVLKDAAAEPLHRQALAMQRKLFPIGHPDTAASLNNLAALLRRQGNLTEAEAMARESVEMRRQLLGKEHPSVAVSLTALAKILGSENKRVEQEATLREIVAMQKKLLGDHPAIVISLDRLAGLLWWWGKYAEAEAVYREELALRKRLDGNDNAGLGGSLTAIGIIIQRQGRFAEAESFHREALAIRKKRIAEDSPDVAISVNNLAIALNGQRKYEQAESMLRTEFAFFQAKLTNHWVAFHMQSLLGECLLGQKKYQEAEEYLVSGYEGMRQRDATIWASAKRELTAASKSVLRLYEVTGKPDAASRFKQQIDVEEVKLDRKLADGGDAEAQNRMGLRHETGSGVPKDMTESVQWYRRAAIQNFAYAQTKLVRIYALGLGVPKDANEAMKWQRKAAEGGGADVLNGFAWQLATSSDPNLRDGSNAVVFAEQAVQLTRRTNNAHLDTLAAAYAEAGDFTKAVATQKEAIALLSDITAITDFKSRLTLYESGQPYHEPANPEEQLTEKYSYAAGYFGKVANSPKWLERGGDDTYNFKELQRDNEMILLRDASRRFRIQIPVQGGTSLLSPDDGVTWQNLYEVRKE